MKFYDIDKAIAESGLPQEVTDGILRQAREDYPDDQMLFELHVIRAIDGELSERMGEEAWTEQFEQSVQQFREEEGLELVSEPLEIVQRLRRKPQAS